MGVVELVCLLHHCSRIALDTATASAVEQHGGGGVAAPRVQKSMHQFQFIDICIES